MVKYATSERLFGLSPPFLFLTLSFPGAVLQTFLHLFSNRLLLTSDLDFIILSIGTNNLDSSSSSEILSLFSHLISTIRSLSPNLTIFICHIIPRGDTLVLDKKRKRVNLFKSLVVPSSVLIVCMEHVFLTKNRVKHQLLARDQPHLSFKDGVSLLSSDQMYPAKNGTKHPRPGNGGCRCPFRVRLVHYLPLPQARCLCSVCAHAKVPMALLLQISQQTRSEAAVNPFANVNW